MRSSRRTRRPLLAALALPLALAACGDDLHLQPDAAPPDAAPAPDAAAPPLGVPQLVNGGGPVMTSPKVVPIFFAGDGELQAQTEEFLRQLATSAYWTQTTSEYGVGALAVAPTVIEAGPAPATEDALLALLRARTGGASPAWPAPDGNTVFVVFLPTDQLTSPYGNACEAYAGYHDDLDGKVIYALIPRCAPSLDFITDVVSHELVEAATDPLPSTDPAWGFMDDDHLAMSYVPGGENGDLCEYLRDVDVRAFGGYAVQRSWSNAAARAGQDPCVPALDRPYAVAAPVLPATVMLDWGDGSGPSPTRGVVAPLGAPTTVELALQADRPAGEVTVVAYDVASELFGAPQELALEVVPASGQVGDRLQLKITRQRKSDVNILFASGSMFLLEAKIGDQYVGQSWGFAQN